MNITVVGTGYVGLSNAVLLSRSNYVTILDIDATKVNLVKPCKSPFKDKEIDKFLSEKKLNLIATVSEEEAYKVPDFVIVATPTDYDEDKKTLDTSNVESVVQIVRVCSR